ncbi:MAG: hypothetical protein ABJN75_15865 [Hoeflea sp.]|uniref:hypothetical protein n=1 Tax=Hoeflea sp. TaxID=1940281 RepID=UPI003296AD81
MSENVKIVAQLSSVHSTDDVLDTGNVARYLDSVGKSIQLDILIAGWQERPDLYRMLTSPDSRQSSEVFLWYPVLSDYPGFDPSHLVVDNHSRRSRGWDGYDGTGIAETFKQSCPNNPDTLLAALGYLEKCMTEYAFDGVFLDKIRFPSAANGLQDVFSCFCPHCMEKAAKSGLDLCEVRAILGGTHDIRTQGRFAKIPPGAPWLELLVADQPLLQQFIRFRADSISEMIATVADRMRNLGKKVSLDVFSPVLAPLVGQDFEALTHHAEWIKPMIYRFGRGPSSLRSELPALIHELGDHLGLDEVQTMKWVANHVDGVAGYSLEELEEVAPLSLIRAETRSALSCFGGTPLYLGLETVSIEGVKEITPRNVEEILEIGSDIGVQGYVLSWDLLHTPIENLKPLMAL